MPKIVSARVILTSPGRNFTTLKIECDDGTTGVGDATLNGRELAVAPGSRMSGNFSIRAPIGVAGP